MGGMPCNCMMSFGGGAILGRVHSKQLLLLPSPTLTTPPPLVQKPGVGRVDRGVKQGGETLQKKPEFSISFVAVGGNPSWREVQLGGNGTWVEVKFFL